MAAIDWNAVIAALRADELPCRGGKRRNLLLSANPAVDIPVGLGDPVTGLDGGNVARLITAIECDRKTPVKETTLIPGR